MLKAIRNHGIVARQIFQRKTIRKNCFTRPINTFLIGNKMVTQELIHNKILLVGSYHPISTHATSTPSVPVVDLTGLMYSVKIECDHPHVVRIIYTIFFEGSLHFFYFCLSSSKDAFIEGLFCFGAKSCTIEDANVGTDEEEEVKDWNFCFGKSSCLFLC